MINEKETPEGGTSGGVNDYQHKSIEPGATQVNSPLPECTHNLPELSQEFVQRGSPTPIPGSVEEHWRLHLSLFEPDDIVWIGWVVWNTGRPFDSDYFHSVAYWLSLPYAPGQLTCASTFRLGTYSRREDNIIARRFFVVDDGAWDADDTYAALTPLVSETRLRAIVDIGFDRCQLWFECPPIEVIEHCRTMLAEIACKYARDQVFFHAAQPCRLAGAQAYYKRPYVGDTYHRLVWLNTTPGREK